jgi:multidrug efflux pump subunit AcrA (membrane-fusion protein)
MDMSRGLRSALAKSHVRNAALLVAGLVVAAAVWLYLSRGVEVKVTIPVRGDAAAVVYATGNVEPVNWAKVAALQRKRIVEICRCEGQPVRKGDILVRLDDDEERAVLTELEARLARYRDDAERLRGLVERNVTARTALDEKLTQVREYEAKVVAQKDREVGEIAGTGVSDVLMWVGQPTPLRVVAEVNEDDILRIKAGQKTLLRHEGHASSPLLATVASLTPKGDPQTKTFRVYLELPPDTPLRIGMSVEANIVVAEARNAWLIPTEALSGNVVQKVENDRIRLLEIETGIRGTRMTEIVGGLAPATRLVSPFKPQLRDGARVFASDAIGKGNAP